MLPTRLLHEKSVLMGSIVLSILVTTTVQKRLWFMALSFAKPKGKEVLNGLMSKPLQNVCITRTIIALIVIVASYFP